MENFPLCAGAQTARIGNSTSKQVEKLGGCV
jgi:hypothetical protein